LNVNPDIDNVATPERIAIIANIVIVFIGFKCAAKTIYDNIYELSTHDTRSQKSG
jgi:hypothetical protein